VEDRAKMARNEYSKKWRARNKEKVKEINARYWRKKADIQEQKDTVETLPQTI
jgi:hypothetical protein